MSYYVPRSITVTFKDGYKKILVYDDFDPADKLTRFFSEVEIMILVHGNVQSIEKSKGGCVSRET